jgi:hypothetical protein
MNIDRTDNGYPIHEEPLEGVSFTDAEYDAAQRTAAQLAGLDYRTLETIVTSLAREVERCSGDAFDLPGFYRADAVEAALLGYLAAKEAFDQLGKEPAVRYYPGLPDQYAAGPADDAVPWAVARYGTVVAYREGRETNETPCDGEAEAIREYERTVAAFLDPRLI